MKSMTLRTLRNVVAGLLALGLWGVGWALRGEGGSIVEVSLSEFRVDVASAGPVLPGTVTFRVKNRGKHKHEFTIFRTELGADSLPTKSKFIVCKVVDEEAHGLDKLGEIEELRPGQTKELALSLSSGAHVLVCNMPCHYQKGMRRALQVQEGERQE